MENNQNPCHVAHLVKDHLTSHDEPGNYRETLDAFFADAVAGLTFEGANSERRSVVYSHYRQLRQFFDELEKM